MLLVQSLVRGLLIQVLLLLLYGRCGPLVWEEWLRLRLFS